MPKRARPHEVRGSYQGYYGKRLQDGPDARLDALDPAWFPAGARVLDVGCNDGTVTRAVAERFACSYVLGTDVDVDLVRRARRDAPAGVFFQREDVAAHEHAAQGYYDVVLCLSVTKWVQAAHGDAGLRAAFATMRAALRPGGRLVLEPQPWRSYVNAVKSGKFRRPLDEIELRPEAFPEALLAAGFASVETLVEGGDRGFNRAILVGVA